MGKLGPAGAQFLGPVMIEIPHCNHIESNDREKIVLRFDSNGRWSEQELINESSIIKSFDESFDQENDVIEIPSTKIFTKKFPQCFLIASRIKQDIFWIGPEGDTAHSSVMPEIKAHFEPNVVSRKGKAITMTIPLPRIPFAKNNVRLISSITSGTSKAQWQDLTNQTKLEFDGNLIKFKTAGLARFCLIETENPSEVVQTVAKLYRDAIER